MYFGFLFDDFYMYPHLYEIKGPVNEIHNAEILREICIQNIPVFVMFA